MNKKVQKKVEPKSEEPKLVVMVREGKEANVHPLEVDNYAKYGWQKK